MELSQCVEHALLIFIRRVSVLPEGEQIIAVLGTDVRIVSEHLRSCNIIGVEITRNLLQRSKVRFVQQDTDRSHEVSIYDEIASALQGQSDDAAMVVTLILQGLVAILFRPWLPLPQLNIGIAAGQQLAVEGIHTVAGPFYVLLSHEQQAVVLDLENQQPSPRGLGFLRQHIASPYHNVLRVVAFKGHAAYCIANFIGIQLVCVEAFKRVVVEQPDIVHFFVQEHVVRHHHSIRR
mmetsp:Transcript_27825/g.47114  ORF Transcript_27825/g.47114 Transcript_27825/m.47114 type:complete len:235 (-) Transcript_27825:2165-2869(-)